MDDSLRNGSSAILFHEGHIFAKTSGTFADSIDILVERWIEAVESLGLITPLSKRQHKQAFSSYQYARICRGFARSRVSVLTEEDITEESIISDLKICHRYEEYPVSLGLEMMTDLVSQEYFSKREISVIAFLSEQLDGKEACLVCSGSKNGIVDIIVREVDGTHVHSAGTGFLSRVKL